MEQILFPLFALAALTFGIGIWMATLRFYAVNKGDLNPSYFQLNRGANVPDYLARVSNNYDNLLALPILFYVVTGLLYTTAKGEFSQVILAWVFVGSRYVHSYIHPTYNNVYHRLGAFFLGVMTLISMWSLFFVRLLQI